MNAARAAYVHVPFCRHRCGYCNFTLVEGRADLVGDYLRAVELELNSPALQERGALGEAGSRRDEVETLYFGGGTPTHLSADALCRLTSAVVARHPLAQGYEFTVEANPADVDAAMIRALRSLGVTRVSLGGQSFREDKLRLLERDHVAADIGRVVLAIREAGMHVALDLIFAAPGEKIDDWRADLEAAIALEPDHVSTYGLTFEEGTSFWTRRLRGDLAEVDEELQREMYALAIDRLAAAGYEQYEVSNFARLGRRSRHNQVYWSGDGYFAYGPGAARYINGVRETNHRSVTTYLRRMLAGKSPVAESECLSREERARELFVFSLRRIEGVSRRSYRMRSGFDCDQLFVGPLSKFIGLGLLEDDGDRIRMTREGLFVSDAMWPEML